MLQTIKYIAFKMLLVLGLFFFTACATEKDHLVTIKTKFGDMTVLLYEQTPQHKANFLRLAREGHYDSTSFHRIIKNFMIQGGDVNAKKGATEKISYTVPAEIVEGFIHEKGALAAARQADQVNPKKASSGDQFYIVHGQIYNDSTFRQLEKDHLMGQLQRKFVALLGKAEYADLRNEYIEIQHSGDQKAMMQKIYDSQELIENEYGAVDAFNLSDQQRQTYTTVGGAPHLDREYTVFGKVVEGMEVIDSVAMQVTGAGGKPRQDVWIKVEVNEMSKKQITERYGYQYPPEK